MLVTELSPRVQSELQNAWNTRTKKKTDWNLLETMRLPHCPMQSKLTSHFDFNFNAYVRVDQIKNARQTSTLAVHNWNPNVKIALSSMKLQTPKNCIWPVWFTKSISLATQTNRHNSHLAKQNYGNTRLSRELSFWQRCLPGRKQITIMRFVHQC